jgi:hypothetical protein
MASIAAQGIPKRYPWQAPLGHMSKLSKSVRIENAPAGLAGQNQGFKRRGAGTGGSVSR